MADEEEPEVSVRTKQSVVGIHGAFCPLVGSLPIGETTLLPSERFDDRLEPG
jgi:hypothetical protein